MLCYSGMSSHFSLVAGIWTIVLVLAFIPSFGSFRRQTNSEEGSVVITVVFIVHREVHRLLPAWLPESQLVTWSFFWCPPSLMESSLLLLLAPESAFVLLAAGDRRIRNHLVVEETSTGLYFPDAAGYSCCHPTTIFKCAVHWEKFQCFLTASTSAWQQHRFACLRRSREI